MPTTIDRTDVDPVTGVTYKVKVRFTTMPEFSAVLCRGCGESVWAAAEVVVEERYDCYVPENRYAFWHRNCHPIVVERIIEVTVKHWKELGLL